MLKNIDPGLLKVIAVVVSVAIVVLAQYYPDAAATLYALAAGLTGSAVVRRPGDIPAHGVHDDDLGGQK